MFHAVVERSGNQVSVSLFDDEHGGAQSATEHALSLIRKNCECDDEEMRSNLQVFDYYEEGEWGVYLTDVTLETPEMYVYPIVVKVARAAGVTDKDLDHDDRVQHPEGIYTYTISAVSLRAAKEQALDEFHRTVPIALLENYDITATHAIEGAVADE